MSMCKLHSEFYRQQAKLDALLNTITEGKNGEGATYIKTARSWLHMAHGVRNTAEGLRYVIYLFVTDLKEPWKVIAEPAGFLIAPRGWERVSDVSNVVFTNGAIADDDGKVYIYYAASDTRLHVASTTIGQLLDFAFKTPADPLRSRDCVAQRVALIEKKSGISQSARPVISCARGPGGGVHPGAIWLPMLALLALLVLDVSVSAQFPVPWGGPLTLRGAASFCLDFAPRPEVVDGIWQRPEWPWKTLPASDSAGAGEDCSLSG